MCLPVSQTRARAYTRAGAYIFDRFNGRPDQVLMVPLPSVVINVPVGTSNVKISMLHSSCCYSSSKLHYRNNIYIYKYIHIENTHSVIHTSFANETDRRVSYSLYRRKVT